MTDHPYAPFIALMDEIAAKPDEPDIDLRKSCRCGACQLARDAAGQDDFLASLLTAPSVTITMPTYVATWVRQALASVPWSSEFDADQRDAIGRVENLLADATDRALADWHNRLP